MDKLVTSMVFCEAPVDFAYGVGVGAAAAGTTVVARAAGGDVAASSKPEPAGAAAAATESSPAKGRQAEVECALAFDGLNCFETVVMRPA